MAQGGDAPLQNNHGLGKKLFTFVVYTDSHLNQSETESMSPHQVNKLANGRHRNVINEINQIGPAFAIHLGDLVHPVPVMGIYVDAAERFHEQVSELNCPLHIIPGNHDIGDKPIRWGPAEAVSDQSLALWEKHFGPHYHAFEHTGCGFILLNAQIINSGLAAEAEQKAWLEANLEAKQGKRLFVGIHYPPFVHRRDELEYYDNIAEPGRSWLIDMFEKYDVEAVFSGHVHNFWYHRICGTDFYILPSITFVRHDYSEMYRIPAGPEAGRNDAVKLGYFVIDVYENGHLCHPIRTNGKTLGIDEPVPASSPILPPPHPRLNMRGNFGLDMRQPWAEIVEIPPNGGLDEFARKIVRNDYPLLALWEMGIRKLRVPFQDLLDARLRDRMQDLKELGMEFSIFSYKLPTEELLAALKEYHALVASWEIGVPPEEAEQMGVSLMALRAECGIAILLSKLRSKEDMETDGQRYYHVINHGFVAGEREMIANLTGEKWFRNVASGLVFRIPRERPPWEEIIEIGEIAKDLNISASVHVRLATSNPAAEACNDLENANRIAETLAASLTQPHIDVYLDTFADADRGYFVRTGVVDRRFNPRLGLKVVRNLYACFGSDAEMISAAGQRETDDCRVVGLQQSKETHALVLPKRTVSRLSLPEEAGAMEGLKFVRLTDLESAEISETELATEADGSMDLNSVKVPDNPFTVSFAR